MYEQCVAAGFTENGREGRAGNSAKESVFIRKDARELPLVFDEGEVEKIYLNFSDPGQKSAMPSAD